MQTKLTPPGTAQLTVAAAACPLCANPTPRRLYRVHTDGDYDVLRCPPCDFVYAGPRPTSEQLAEFYSSTYFKRKNEVRLGYADYRGLAETNARYMWTFFSENYLKGLTHKGRLLDVGCATGAFLAEAQRSGWTCTGLELSGDAVEVAREEFKVNAIQGDLCARELNADSFELVTMWHVLEHLIDPADAIRRVKRLLVSGGRLYIELPNWNSLGRVAKGAAWSQLRPPEHINFFTPRSLTALASNAGLHVVQCKTAYPSLRDKARVCRLSKPLHICVAGIAMMAEFLGCGGYIRLLAENT